MSFDEQRRRSRRRQLTEEEEQLWNGIIRLITPLKRRRRPARPAQSVDLAPKPSSPAPARPRSEIAPPRPAAALPLSPIERRQRQRLVRGTAPIDARIDLHGRSQAQAHATLLGFLARAQAEGARFVLVITGKGGAGDARVGRGILKRNVPQWLRLPEFRRYVLGAEEAHAAHGGEGALYVRIRRPRA
jgi:DNA-nicking Smr family endonuclease